MSFRNGGLVKNDGQVISHAAEPGKIQGGRAVTNDVGVHKRAEETRAQLAAIVEASGDAIISRALDGTILSWNAAAERLYGYTAAEAIGSTNLNLAPPELRREIAEIRELIGRGETVASRDTVRVTKDGRRINVSRTTSPIKDDSGKVVKVKVIKRNRAKRKPMTAQVLAARMKADATQVN